MIKKIKILILILSIALGSCVRDNSYRPAVSGDYNTSSSFLTGQWTMCSEGTENGSMIQYNVCPKIEFNINGKMYITTGKTRTQQWTTKGDTLYINPNSNDSANWFNESKYLILMSGDSNSINITLKQPETKNIYNLSKDNPGLHIGLERINK